MSNYIYTNGELINVDDELNHYGVLGMKWGVRKSPSATFAKASTHLDRLKSKSAQLESKSKTLTDKGMNKRYRTEIGYGLSNNRLAKARKLHKKSLKIDKKVARFEKAMTDTFKNIKVSDISKEDLVTGRNYINMLKQDRRVRRRR